MPRTRIELDEELRGVIGNDHVYFQPPESIKLRYPCIVYHKTDIPTKHADNRVYHEMGCYDVTIISKDPDYYLFDEFLHAFPMCSRGRSYTADNLNHVPYTLYY